MGELLIDRPADGVAVLTLNRPDKLNAVTLALQYELDAALTELAADGKTGAVVITGTGDRAFSAGYDVHEMGEWSSDELLMRMLEREPLVERVATCPLPIVAALNGVTYGIGAIIATCVDIRIGCPQTVWRFTSGQHGGANATWSLPSIVGRSRAGELLLTGRKIDAPEAEHLGLVHHVVPAARLLDDAVGTAVQIASQPAAGNRAIKRLLREGVGRSVQDAYIAENIAMRTELRPRPISELYEGFLRK